MCAIFPRDGFEAGAVMDLDKARWTDWTKRQTDRQDRQKDQKQTDIQTNIHLKMHIYRETDT